MSGTGFTGSYYNLANNTYGSDVIYAPDTGGETGIFDLNTSLWSFSTLTSTRVNGMTINMQAYDIGLTGPTGQYYYAIRVNTDTNKLIYGNIRISSVSFN